jgi:hypothetical protein
MGIERDINQGNSTELNEKNRTERKINERRELKGTLIKGITRDVDQGNRKGKGLYFLATDDYHLPCVRIGC